MTSESTIAIQIRTALAQHLKRDVSKMRPQDRLREDLGLDSLAMIELLFKIEEHFDLEIPNEDLSRITTVADVTAYVEEKLGATGARRWPAAPGEAARAERTEGPRAGDARERESEPEPPPEPARDARARPPRSRRSRWRRSGRPRRHLPRPPTKKQGSRRA